MKIVILGGCGYIGSVLWEYLISQQLETDTVDLEWFGNYSNPSNFIADFSCLPKSFYQKYQAVILLAGHSSVQMCQNNRDSVFKNNVSNFMELLGKLDNQKFIYASSSSLYAGLSGEAKETECSYLVSNYYDLSKKEIDLYAELSNLNYYGLRFATVNGASPNFRGDLMINKMYLTAMQTGVIEVYNEHVRRPILALNDLCRAIFQILIGPDNPGIYNIASFNARVGEIAKEVAQLTNTQYVNKGFSDTYDFHISTDKFCNVFNFTFNETISSIVDSLKNESYTVTLRDKPVIYGL